jgi:hypothetical protein
MGADAESREILRLVAAAERATFGWLRARAGTHVGRLAPTGS